MEPPKKMRRVGFDLKMSYSVDTQLQMILKKARDSKMIEEQKKEGKEECVAIKHVSDVEEFERLFEHFKKEQKKHENNPEHPIYSNGFDFQKYKKYYNSISSSNSDVYFKEYNFHKYKEYYDSISSANGASMSSSSSSSS